MLVPYKSHYGLGEFWDVLTTGTLYKTYARDNPVESAQLALHVERKIAELADTMPIGFAKTATGRALVMVLCSLSGGKPTG